MMSLVTYRPRGLSGSHGSLDDRKKLMESSIGMTCKRTGTHGKCRECNGLELCGMTNDLWVPEVA
jgi:hypothetical protein